MKAIIADRPTWKEVLAKHPLLILPAAHNALAARLIERAGFPAYQIGGFAIAGTMHAVPDVDLEHFGEKSEAARDIINASPLPVLVDADNGYGDVKNVTRTVLEYEAMGASAIFIEDQVSPKRCGHMNGKEVVRAEEMEEKIRAAVGERKSADFFVLARTDAIEPCGIDEALRRGERYLKAGADGVYVEGPRSVEELEQVGRAFRGVPLATSILEGGGKTPWLPPDQLRSMGFTMILYPTTILFQATRTMERAIQNLKAGRPMPEENAVDMGGFEQIVEMPYWSEIEKRYQGEKK
ncbi:MAG TPA: isocitrate lyase/PEP mutase family protein [Capsulimonadaceae bacterium]|nr:isocitrate lyase/PEP mutase family protein [Capsulimonadaceae bacterium]